MDISSLLEKYKAMEFKTDGTLFGIDPLIAVVQHRCPYCSCKLYAMRNKPFHYCRSKSHKNKFIIASNKLK